jgi:hypothetical protein
MSDTTATDDNAGGDAGGNAEPVADGGSIFGAAGVIDPNAWGSPRGSAGSSGSIFGRSGGIDAGGSGDAAGNSGGTGGDGGGPYGHGYFANGKPRKRAARNPAGSQAGSSKKPNGNTIPLEPSTVEFYLFAVHTMLSKLLEQRVPVEQRVLALERDDAARLAKATCNAARHFPIMQQSQKAADVGALIAVAASIYGPMVWLFMEQRATTQGSKTPQGENVYAWPGQA